MNGVDTLWPRVVVPDRSCADAALFTEDRQESGAPADWPHRPHCDGTTSAPSDLRQHRYARYEDRPACLAPAVPVIGGQPAVDNFGDLDLAVPKPEPSRRLLAAIAGVALDIHHRKCGRIS